jgi:excisionase family DNA binding protein
MAAKRGILATRRPSEGTKLLTVEEAAERLNVSVRNVREHIYRRRLPIVKIGRLLSGLRKGTGRLHRTGLYDLEVPSPWWFFSTYFVERH